MRTRFDRLPVVMVASITLVTACGSATSAARADGLEVAAHEPTGEGGDDALLSGTVEDDGGCLTIRTEGGGDVAYVPVFASNDRRAGRITVGSVVQFGGGAVPSTGAGFEGYPDVCPQDGPFWIVAQP